MMPSPIASEAAKSQQILNLQTSRTHILYVKRRTCKILEVEDTHFNFSSAVFIPPEKKSPGNDHPPGNKDRTNPELRSSLEKYYDLMADNWFNVPFVPEGEPAPEDDGTKQFDDLHILAAVYRYAPGHDVLLAGHTDTVGSDAENQKLSEARAKSICCLLLGKITNGSGVAIYKNEWYRIIQNRSKVEDYQCILTHFSERYHWDCHPGPIDNVHGPQTSKAVRNFQKTYNEEFSAQIPEDGVVGEKTWKAVFDVYMKELAELVGGEDKLRLEQAKLQQQFLDEENPVIGCGERYPLEAQGQDNYKSKKNRRVEILYFPKGTGPTKDTAEDKVYKRKIYDYEYISPDGGGGTGGQDDHSWGDIAAIRISEGTAGEEYQTECDLYPRNESDPWDFVNPINDTFPPMNQKPQDEPSAV